MRDKNYRRKEEAKHYKARFDFLSKGNIKLLKETDLSGKDEKIKNRMLHKMKNGDLKYGLYDKWDKKFSNKRRRLFQKTVDYKLPHNVFLKRQHVNPQVPDYSVDSLEDYNPRYKAFKFDIYPDE